MVPRFDMDQRATRRFASALSKLLSRSNSLPESRTWYFLLLLVSSLLLGGTQTAGAQASLSLTPDSARLSCMRSTRMDLVAAPGALEGVQALILDFDERVIEIDLLSSGAPENTSTFAWRVSPLSAPGRLRLEPGAMTTADAARGSIVGLQVRALVAGESGIRLWRDEGATGRLGREAARVLVTCAGMTPVPASDLDVGRPGGDSDAGGDAAGDDSAGGDASERPSGAAGDALRSLPPPPAALPVAGQAEVASSDHPAASGMPQRIAAHPERCFLTLRPATSAVDLALRHDLPILELARANRLISLRAARAGTVLRVPGCGALR